MSEGQDSRESLDLQPQIPEPTGDARLDHAAREAFVRRIIAQSGLPRISSDLTYIMADLGTPPIDPEQGHTVLEHSVGVKGIVRRIREGIDRLDGMTFPVEQDSAEHELAAFLHDVGKYGPVRMFGLLPPGENPLIKFFNINFDPKKYPPVQTPVKTALELAIRWGFITVFDAYCITEAIKSSGVKVDECTLRDFYNLHTYWGSLNLEGENLPDDVKIVAPPHHNVNRTSKHPINRILYPRDLTGTAVIETADKVDALISRRANIIVGSTVDGAIEMVRQSIDGCVFPEVRDMYTAFMQGVTRSGVLKQAVVEERQARKRARKAKETA